MTYLSLKALKKSYGVVRVIQGLDLTIAKGELISLLGASGSGKTTILRCIAGLEGVDAQDGGTISLAGETLTDGRKSLPPERRAMGMVFQNYAVWPHLTVFENVAFPLRIQRASDADVEKRTNETLSLVKLSPYTKRYPHELSGGQQQRVALARALVATPRVLLLDEPLSNLDALLRDELGAEIRRLQKALDLTTILVTHDQKEALSLSDRIVVLEKGKIEADGAPEDLYRDPPGEFVAEFLAGGQRIGGKLYLPRRWKVDSAGDRAARITTRIYRGNEYEYFAEIEGIGEAIRFFAEARYDMGAALKLAYT